MAPCAALLSCTTVRTVLRDHHHHHHPHRPGHETRAYAVRKLLRPPLATRSTRLCQLATRLARAPPVPRQRPHNNAGLRLSSCSLQHSHGVVPAPTAAPTPICLFKGATTLRSCAPGTCGAPARLHVPTCRRLLCTDSPAICTLKQPGLSPVCRCHRRRCPSSCLSLQLPLCRDVRRAEVYDLTVNSHAPAAVLRHGGVKSSLGQIVVHGVHACTQSYRCSMLPHSFLLFQMHVISKDTIALVPDSSWPP